MAEIKFYSNIKADDSVAVIDHAAGSGVGFYGNDYGISVPVGQRQDSTWVTNSNGTAISPTQLHNDKFVTVSTASVDGLAETNLRNLPNYLTPLNIRFTHTDAVRVQNCKLRIFDRADITKHASGVVTYVFEARHPSVDQSVSNLNFRGTAANSWTEFDSADSATPADMVFTNSPGVSGFNTDSTDTLVSKGYTSTEGSAHTSTTHDWYVGMSAEPSEIGSKTNYGLYFTVEYL